MGRERGSKATVQILVASEIEFHASKPLPRNWWRCCERPASYCCMHQLPCPPDGPRMSGAAMSRLPRHGRRHENRTLGRCLYTTMGALCTAGASAAAASSIATGTHCSRRLGAFGIWGSTRSPWELGSGLQSERQAREPPRGPAMPCPSRRGRWSTHGRMTSTPLA